MRKWGEHPASDGSKYTHTQIRKALQKSGVINGCYVYLQGSYKNHTNIRNDSDVDIVVQINPESTSATTYDEWKKFRRAVINALENYFGSSLVRPGNKSIKLMGYASRTNADIVPCIQYWEYEKGRPNNFIEGMKFWADNQHREIINFPKVHIEKGELKDKLTSNRYTRLVRVVKNIKRQLVKDRIIHAKIASSYFIECMIHKAPNGYFNDDIEVSLENVLEFILKNCNLKIWRAANQQQLLFGTEPGQWNKDDAVAFFRAAENLYYS